VLTLLARLEDTERVDEFVAVVIAGGHHQKSDNEAILGGLRLLPPDRAAALLRCVVAGTAATSLDACGDLLARSAAVFPDGPTGLLGAAATLIEGLPGDPSRAPPRDPWQHAPGVKPSFVVDLFNAAGRLDDTLAERAASHLLAWPKTYGLDSVLIPAVRQMIGSAVITDCTAVERLRIACVAHLRARVAEPLEAPRDWRRASKLACQCPHCGELSRFLAGPERETWTFKAAEAARRHVEDTIRKARCDLDVTTHRRGSPYSLVCTKNQASYDRRLKQRNQDLADLERFEG